MPNSDVTSLLKSPKRSDVLKICHWAATKIVNNFRTVWDTEPTLHWALKETTDTQSIDDVSFNLRKTQVLIKPNWILLIIINNFYWNREDVINSSHPSLWWAKMKLGWFLVSAIWTSGFFFVGCSSYQQIFWTIHTNLNWLTLWGSNFHAPRTGAKSFMSNFSKTNLLAPFAPQINKEVIILLMLLFCIMKPWASVVPRALCKLFFKKKTVHFRNETYRNCHLHVTNDASSSWELHGHLGASFIHRFQAHFKTNYDVRRICVRSSPQAVFVDCSSGSTRRIYERPWSGCQVKSQGYHPSP